MVAKERPGEIRGWAAEGWFYEMGKERCCKEELAKATGFAFLHLKRSIWALIDKRCLPNFDWGCLHRASISAHSVIV